MENKTLNISKDPPCKRGIFCFRAFAVLVFIFSSISSFSQAQIKFVDAKKSFGFVKKGEIVTVEFDFTNTGNEPLIITDAKFECSCTSVEYPKRPIKPAETGKVLVKFDTKNVYDRQDRTVEIVSNAKNSPNNIRFKGVVLKK